MVGTFKNVRRLFSHATTNSVYTNTLLATLNARKMIRGSCDYIHNIDTPITGNRVTLSLPELSSTSGNSSRVSFELPVPFFFFQMWRFEFFFLSLTQPFYPPKQQRTAPSISIKIDTTKESVADFQERDHDKDQVVVRFSQLTCSLKNLTYISCASAYSHRVRVLGLPLTLKQNIPTIHNEM